MGLLVKTVGYFNFTMYIFQYLCHLNLVYHLPYVIIVGVLVSVGKS